MVKVKERGRTKAPETSNLASDTRAAEPVPPAEQEAEDGQDAALAFIRAMPPESRCRSLMFVGLLGPVEERQAVLLEALDAATSIPDETARAQLAHALGALAPHLPQTPPRVAPATKGKDEVDKSDETSHNSPDINQPRKARGKDEGAMNALNKYLKELGVTEPVTAKQAARIGAFAKSEVTGCAVAPKLSEAALAAFMEHAAANQWNPESKPKVSPSAFIKETFKEWLGRGLTRKHIEDAQENLAWAYSTEVCRKASRRVEGLISARENLPIGAPRPPSSRPVAELSGKEKTERREKKATAQRRWRKKPHGEAPRLSL